MKTSLRKVCSDFTFVFLTAIVLFSCTAGDAGWDASKITSQLNQLFPTADSVFITDAVTADNIDSLGLPPPGYKACIKEKNVPGYEFIFFFYNSSPLDTAVFIPLMKAVTVHDLKTVIGNKEPGYLLSMPFFDSTGENKMMVIALSAFTEKDPRWLSEKQKEILHVFGLKAISAKQKK